MTADRTPLTAEREAEIRDLTASEEQYALDASDGLIVSLREEHVALRDLLAELDAVRKERDAYWRRLQWAESVLSERKAREETTT